MKAGILVCLAVLSLLPLSTGCASMYRSRVNQELWERELRLQEDCIYRLKWQLEDTQRALAEANQRLGTANKAADVLRGGPELTVPRTSPGARGGEAPPALPPAPNLPEIQQGQEFTPGGSSGSNKSPGGSRGFCFWSDRGREPCRGGARAKQKPRPQDAAPGSSSIG